jgi:hypothetical protein
LPTVPTPTPPAPTSPGDVGGAASSHAGPPTPCPQFLGSWRAGADGVLLSKLGITHAICLCAGDGCNPPCVQPEFRWGGAAHVVEAWPKLAGAWLAFCARDEPSYDVAAHFAECNAFIDDALLGGGKVLVFCRAGASRSASVVLAFLCHAYRLSVTGAESLALSRRPDVCLNEGFRSQLEAWASAPFYLERAGCLPSDDRACSV